MHLQTAKKSKGKKKFLDLINFCAWRSVLWCAATTVTTSKHITHWPVSISSRLGVWRRVKRKRWIGYSSFQVEAMPYYWKGALTKKILEHFNACEGLDPSCFLLIIVFICLWPVRKHRSVYGPGYCCHPHRRTVEAARQATQVGIYSASASKITSHCWWCDNRYLKEKTVSVSKRVCSI